MIDNEALAAHNLLRHVPPKDIENRLFDTLELNPNLADDLLSKVDIPFQVTYDPDTHKPFIKCDYNRDLDSYRSPYSNKYVPDLPDGLLPPKRLRKMEEMAANVLSQYNLLYYDKGAISSAYCWEIEDSIFGFGIFARKSVSDTYFDDGNYMDGSINSSDIVKVTLLENGKFSYHIVSSVLLYLTIGVDNAEPLVLSGSTANEQTHELDAEDDIAHIVNILEIVEKSNQNFMSKVENIYVLKMKEILSRSRTFKDQKTANDQQDVQAKSVTAALGS
ncbi:F-actin-capping protein subunit beta [Tritrichomonas foetus]|uniref:F-actin-capping protein subunit beta n=1 Tax=Tritrichomonas foetus TaxID=1144522 RepID=A0A1J4KUC8_9EUKA|nr:F-actin-capping protein subunit beta [Tritrichomonas foetus]|eukprot:OHT14496.1 F-actin-capping protein subunit beta [Tritrichomonas foetus]